MSTEVWTKLFKRSIDDSCFLPQSQSALSRSVFFYFSPQGQKMSPYVKSMTILQIQSSISSLQLELNESQSLIEDAQTYLSEHVMDFNGSVRIVPAIPSMYPSFPVVCPSGGGVSVIVDWQCIEAMATSYRQRAMQANESGHANYSSIQSSYSVVSEPN